MYDEIDDSTIALEWLDATLAEVPYRPEMRTYALINASLDAALSSCVVLASGKHVNTDYKPANILLSGIETDRATAKIGDLGLGKGALMYGIDGLLLRCLQCFQMAIV